MWNVVKIICRTNEVSILVREILRVKSIDSLSLNLSLYNQLYC